MTRRWAPQTRYTLQRNTASTMNGKVNITEAFDAPLSNNACIVVEDEEN